MRRGLPLELRIGDQGAVTYFLEETPVYPGQDLEILLEGRLWLLGRFEWNGRRESRPCLHVACGGMWEDMENPETSTFPIPPEIKFEIPAEALLRRPRGD